MYGGRERRPWRRGERPVTADALREPAGEVATGRSRRRQRSERDDGRDHRRAGGSRLSRASAGRALRDHRRRPDRHRDPDRAGAGRARGRRGSSRRELRAAGSKRCGAAGLRRCSDGRRRCRPLRRQHVPVPHLGQGGGAASGRTGRFQRAVPGRCVAGRRDDRGLLCDPGACRAAGRAVAPHRTRSA